MRYVIATILVILALPAILLASIFIGVCVAIDMVAEAIERIF